MDSLLRSGGATSRSRGVYICLLVALVALTAPAVLGGSVAFADDRPPGGNFGSTVVRAVDIAQPAIVRLATLYTATVTIPICGQTLTLPSSGGGYVAGGTGSGSFVSSNGDILTADHVVDIPKTDLDSEILGDPQSQAAQDAADAVNRACHPTPQLTATDVANGVLQSNGITPRIDYSAPQRLVWQDTSYTGPTSSGTPSSFLDGLMSAPHSNATVVASSAVDQNDLAVVHVELMDTPSIQLDNSTSVAVQDQLTIIGFPGNGDVSTSATDLFTPSVNVISVSAIKAGDNGAQLIQVGGNVEHGDSGGPALDAAGHIVGVVSFGGPDAGSTAFLRSSNDALSLITGAGISVQPGTFQTLWQQAFSDYAATSAGHWHKAARELDAIAASYPSFKGVQPYKDYADRAAQTETVATNTTTLVAIAAAGLVVVLLLVGLIILLLTRGRKRPQQQLVGVAAGGQAMYYSNGYPTGYPSGYPPSGYGPPVSYGGYGQPVGYPQQPGAYGGQVAPQLPVTGGEGALPAGQPGGAEAWPYAPPQVPYALPPDAYPSAPQTPVYTPPVESPPAAGTWTNGSGWPAVSVTSPGFAQEQATCVNGHPMAAHEVYCALCGAPRAASYPSAPPSAS